jgi:hypothetical protein
MLPQKCAASPQAQKQQGQPKVQTVSQNTCRSLSSPTPAEQMVKQDLYLLLKIVSATQENKQIVPFSLKTLFICFYFFHVTVLPSFLSQASKLLVLQM